MIYDEIDGRMGDNEPPEIAIPGFLHLRCDERREILKHFDGRRMSRFEVAELIDWVGAEPDERPRRPPADEIEQPPLRAFMRRRFE
jgi:hypothetical protein